MKTRLLVTAIQNLRPDSQFTFQDDDYSTIEWHILDGDAPTKAEVDAELKKIMVEEEAKATAKAALLDRLGITAEEAKILLG